MNCHPCTRNGPAKAGGEKGIRTLGTVSRTHAFQACSFNHSDISPFRINKLRAVANNYRTRRSNSGIVRPSRSYSTISRVRRSIVETNCVTPHLVRSITAIVDRSALCGGRANFSGQLSSTRRGSCGTDVNGRQNRKRCPCLLGRYCSTTALITGTWCGKEHRGVTGLRHASIARTPG